MMPLSGAAYVFDRVGTTWTQKAKLQGDASKYDHKGTAVAVNGDIVVVNGDGGGERFGNVNVFRLVAGTWSAPMRFSSGGLNAIDFNKGAISIGADNTPCDRRPDTTSTTRRLFYKLTLQ